MSVSEFELLHGNIWQFSSITFSLILGMLHELVMKAFRHDKSNLKLRSRLDRSVEL